MQGELISRDRNDYTDDEEDHIERKTACTFHVKITYNIILITRCCKRILYELSRHYDMKSPVRKIKIEEKVYGTVRLRTQARMKRKFKDTGEGKE